MAVIRLTDRTGSWRTRLAAPLSPLCLAFWTLHSRWLAAALEPASTASACQLRFSHDITRSVCAAVCVCVCVDVCVSVSGKFLTRTWQLSHQGQGNDISGTQEHHAQWVSLQGENLWKTQEDFPTVFLVIILLVLESYYFYNSGKSTRFRKVLYKKLYMIYK